jgi:hypothetical protein
MVQFLEDRVLFYIGRDASATALRKYAGSIHYAAFSLPVLSTARKDLWLPLFP